MFRFILKQGRNSVYVRGIDKNISGTYETDKQKEVAACAASEGLIMVGTDAEAKEKERLAKIAEYRANVKPPVVDPEPPPPVREQAPETPRSQEIRTYHKIKKGK
jgi:hypothetical protein